MTRLRGLQGTNGQMIINTSQMVRGSALQSLDETLRMRLVSYGISPDHHMSLSTKLNKGTTHFDVCESHSQTMCVGSRQGCHAIADLLLACENLRILSSCISHVSCCRTLAVTKSASLAETENS